MYWCSIFHLMQKKMLLECKYAIFKPPTAINHPLRCVKIIIVLQGVACTNQSYSQCSSESAEKSAKFNKLQFEVIEQLE